MSEQQAYLTLLSEEDGINRIMSCSDEDQARKLLDFILSENFQLSIAKSLDKFLANNYQQLYSEFRDKIDFVINGGNNSDELIVRPSKYSSGEY